MMVLPLPLACLSLIDAHLSLYSWTLAVKQQELLVEHALPLWQEMHRYQMTDPRLREHAVGQWKSLPLDRLFYLANIR